VAKFRATLIKLVFSLSTPEHPSMRVMARMLEPCCLLLAIVIRSSGWSSNESAVVQGHSASVPHVQRLQHMRSNPRHVSADFNQEIDSFEASVDLIGDGLQGLE